MLSLFCDDHYWCYIRKLGEKTAGTSVVRFWFLGQLPRIDIAVLNFEEKTELEPESRTSLWLELEPAPKLVLNMFWFFIF
jgi:hypothetical protein